MCLLFYFTLPPWHECIEIAEGENRMVVSTAKEEENEGLEECNANEIN